MTRYEYSTEVHKGGLIDLTNGVHRSGKAITSAERDLSAEASGRGKVTITYADGCKYVLECDREETDEKIKLTNISETWYNGLETIVLTGGT